MSLKIYNHLTREKEIFHPIHDGFIGLYVCGPTVYGHAHVGHAKAYITYDVIHRYLEFLGYKVRYVQNITDVGHLVGDGDVGEDKINTQAKREQIEPMKIVESYTRSYFEDMDTLNVMRPDISPRASGHVPEQLELAELLLQKGYAYEKNGSVFFSVKKWPGYGKLSGRKIEELEEGARIEINPDKTDPRDFCVWRKAKPGQIMVWKSPWGIGIPGWHAECTVMAKKYLGLPFDIHGGGLENIFPHNESEIAQCEAAYHSEFAKIWVLNNMVTVDGVKMGKSLGNFITIKALLADLSPMTIRFYILSNHYRSVTDFTQDGLEAAAKGYNRILETIRAVRKELSYSPQDDNTDSSFENILETHKTKFFDAMDDDFNAPKALSAIFNLNKEVNALLHQEHRPGKKTLEMINTTYTELVGNILGLLPEDFSTMSIETNIESDLIQLLIDVRTTMRSKKEWTLADKIRDDLESLGVMVKDRPDGTTEWHRK